MLHSNFCSSIRTSLEICLTSLSFYLQTVPESSPTLALPSPESQQPMDVEREDSEDEEEAGEVDLPLLAHRAGYGRANDRANFF